MKLYFHSPVPSRCPFKFFGIFPYAAYIISIFLFLCSICLFHSLMDHSETFEFFPLFPFTVPARIFRDIVFPDCASAMFRLCCFFVTPFFSFQLFQYALFKIAFDLFIKQPLVSLQGKHIVPFPRYNRRNCLLLAVHGICRYDRIPQIHQSQQLLRCRYLVCFLLNKFL